LRYWHKSIINYMPPLIFIALLSVMIFSEIRFQDDNIFAVNIFGSIYTSTNLLSLYYIIHYVLFLIILCKIIFNDINTSLSQILFSSHYTRNQIIFFNLSGFFVYTMSYSIVNSLLISILFLFKESFPIYFVLSIMMLPFLLALLFIFSLFIVLISKNMASSILKGIVYLLIISPLLFVYNKTDLFDPSIESSSSTVIQYLVDSIYYLLPNLNGSIVMFVNLHRNMMLNWSSLVEVIGSFIPILFISILILNKKDF
jgi:hypothetical protein